MITTRQSLIATAIAALLLSACSTVPERHVALDQARQQFAMVQADPQSNQHAGDELRRARSALQLAEQAQQDRKPRVEIDHLAYLATQRIALTQASAETRRAQAQVAGAAAERDRMLMAQRTQEADRAERALVQSQQQGQIKDQQLAQADRELAQAGRDANAVAAQADRDAMARAAQEARDQAQIGNLEQQLRELDARKTERGHVLTLGDMLFDSGRATLQPGAQSRITRLSEFLQRHPQQRADIEGFTDSQGSEESNQLLSERRANAVMQALVSRGVAADRLSPRGQGEAMPVASNDSAAGRQANRRVEVVFPLVSGISSMAAPGGTSR
jgi:outer membrane protein OmpA-like peptidoglycan-associated protein